MVNKYMDFNEAKKKLIGVFKEYDIKCKKENKMSFILENSIKISKSEISEFKKFLESKENYESFGDVGFQKKQNLSRT